MSLKELCVLWSWTKGWEVQASTYTGRLLLLTFHCILCTAINTAKLHIWTTPSMYVRNRLFVCVCMQASLLNSSLGVYTYFSCSKVRSWNTTRHPCYNIYTFYFQFSRSIFSNILSLTVPASEFTIYMKEVPWVKYIQGAWLLSFINPLPPPFLFSASPLLSPSSSPPLPACNQQHLPDNHRYCLRQERLNPFPTVQEGSWSLES